MTHFRQLVVLLLRVFSNTTNTTKRKYTKDPKTAESVNLYQQIILGQCDSHTWIVWNDMDQWPC